jgi:hypothetical protein
MNGDVYITLERAELSQFLQEIETKSKGRIQLTNLASGQSILDSPKKTETRHCKIEPAKMIGQQLDRVNKLFQVSMLNDINQANVLKHVRKQEQFTSLQNKAKSILKKISRRENRARSNSVERGRQEIGQKRTYQERDGGDDSNSISSSQRDHMEDGKGNKNQKRQRRNETNQNQNQGQTQEPLELLKQLVTQI